MAAVKHDSSPSSTRELQTLIAALFFLALLLIGQIILADREVLAKHAVWRPVIAALCPLAGCLVPGWHEPGALVPMQQSILSDPNQDGVLRVRLSFKNSANFAQGWPQIELRLLGIEGQKLGLRRFSPEHYLNANAPAFINPMQTVSVEIALQETSSKAASFEFDFY